MKRNSRNSTNGNGKVPYGEFLARKAQLSGGSGFKPLWLPDFLMDFQRHLDDWSIRRGRAGVFAGCGLGKTPIYLVWAENVVRHTNRPVLVATTLGDSSQALHEAEKFGVEAVRSRDGKCPKGVRVVVTNYERLHKFDPKDFAGMVGNESGILKNFDGVTKAAVIEFMRTLPYRLLCTATPSPNDYIELGNSSEALGELGYQDMLTRFFIRENKAARYATGAGAGWARDQYRMKGHAERDFWRWICSWARACRKPSDLGDFDDSKFILPPLVLREHVVSPKKPRAGYFFDPPVMRLDEQRDELRRTLAERCEKVAELLTHKKSALAWCQLNAEGKLLTRLIPDAVEVSGADDDEAKEEKIDAFSSGQIRCLVSKPKIAGFGLNWQHCAHMSFFPSHSWESWHQAIARCWRFGQKSPVTVDEVTTPGMANVLENRKKKEAKVDAMFGRLVELMGEGMRITTGHNFAEKERRPSWL